MSLVEVSHRRGPVSWSDYRNMDCAMDRDAATRARGPLGGGADVSDQQVNLADPAFQAAVNSIPLVFKGKEGVLAAWAEYMATVNMAVPPGERSS